MPQDHRQDHTIVLEPLIEQSTANGTLNELQRHDQSNQQSLRTQSIKQSWFHQSRFSYFHVILLTSLFVSATLIATFYVKHIFEQSINRYANVSNTPVVSNLSINQSSNQSVNQYHAEDTYERVFNRWSDSCAFNNSFWTMNRLTASYVDSKRNVDLPACQTSDQVLKSIKYGTRHPFINDSIHLTLPTDEHKGSVFVPNQCAITWLDNSAMCSILSPFSHLAIIGDSMSRHFTHAFYTAITEDWRMGGLAPLNPDSKLFDNCQCDRIFNEGPTCKTYISDNLYHSNDLRGHGVCYDSINSHVRPTGVNYHPHHGPHGVEPENYKYLCKPNDVRPRFILLQGMWHFEANSNAVINQLIDPIIYQINNASANCEKPFEYRLLFILGHSQSRRLDKPYPHQSRERVAVTNDQIRHHVETRWNHDVLDLWNLTREAVSWDGLHHLTDVNLMKVQYVLNYMKFVAER